MGDVFIIGFCFDGVNAPQRTFLTCEQKMARIMKGSTMRNTTKILIEAIICVLVALSFASTVYGTSVSYEIPSTIDPSARYFIFLHNYYVEQHGPDGACKYHDILQFFADNGFKVISEVRSGAIIPCEYAPKIVR